MTIRERKLFLKRIARQAYQIAKQVRATVPEAYQYFRYFGRRAMVALPLVSCKGQPMLRPYGPLLPSHYRGGNGNNALAVIILTTADAALHEKWAVWVNKQSLITYLPSAHCIAFNLAIPLETDQALACYLLRMVAHALRAKLTGRALTSEALWATEYIKIQVALSEFEYRLFEALSGGAYGTAMTRHAQLLLDQLPRLTSQVISFAGHGSIMTPFMGTAQFPSVQTARDKLVALHLALRTVDLARDQQVHFPFTKEGIIQGLYNPSTSTFTKEARS
jgi:hypothetical protein